jgi:hypothetical protein
MLAHCVVDPVRQSGVGIFFSTSLSLYLVGESSSMFILGHIGMTPSVVAYLKESGLIAHRRHRHLLGISTWDSAFLCSFVIPEAAC